jgi:predicted restriction endonuclease
MNFNNDTEKYIYHLGRLNRAFNKGLGFAPHKPVLLLSLFELIQKGDINSNRIFITPELVISFKDNWKKLVVTGHTENFALPFFHLRSEPFWHLKSKTQLHFFFLSLHSTVFLSNAPIVLTMSRMHFSSWCVRLCRHLESICTSRHLLTQVRQVRIQSAANSETLDTPRISLMMKSKMMHFTSGRCCTQ